jgi:hypothetical protein
LGWEWGILPHAGHGNTSPALNLHIHPAQVLGPRVGQALV